MLVLNDGRKQLYQWDTGRTASVSIDCDIVHFSNLTYGEALTVQVKNGEVEIPNQLLANGSPVHCWAFILDENGAYTKQEQTIDVIKRGKPSDYVYTQTEVITIQAAVENALEKAKESGDFKGDKGDKGEQGERGLQGIQGERGADGAKGDKGEKGDRGEQGIQGVQGIQGAKGEKGAQGQKGADGTPATHRWSGTTLYITSASGTSSANLKGEKGDKGDKGDTGAAGKDGANGKTPVRGTDYWTDTDKTDMLNDVLAALPTWNGGSY